MPRTGFAFAAAAVWLGLLVWWTHRAVGLWIAGATCFLLGAWWIVFAWDLVETEMPDGGFRAAWICLAAVVTFAIGGTCISAARRPGSGIHRSAHARIHELADDPELERGVLAMLGRRFTARSLDVALLGSLMVGPLTAADAVVGLFHPPAFDKWAAVLACAAIFGYELVSTAALGQTFGKAVMSIWVSDVTGGALSWWRAAVRSVFVMFAAFIVTGIAYLISTLFRKDGAALHDLASRSRVRRVHRRT
ncbi:MAG TPA: RDD family protein [Actinomycetota bacterium]|nr:RDD family protein [Actinomycetota bacterium]